MGERGAVVGDCPGRVASISFAVRKSFSRSAGSWADGVLMCSNAALIVALSCLSWNASSRGCMWDGTMLMMTSMGLFLSFEGIGNSARGGCGLDRQMAIWRHD